MSAFTPTLRMEITDETFRDFNEAGLTIEVAAEQLAGVFRSANVTDGLRFTCESIVLVETGQVLKNFQSGVAAIFEIDDVVHLKLDTGDVVEIKFYRV